MAYLILGVTLLFILSSSYLLFKVRASYFSEIKNNKAFLSDFLKDYRKFTTLYFNKNLDTNLYNSLLTRSDKVQSILGKIGIVYYKPPQRYQGVNWAVRNYEIILETLPDIRSGVAEKSMIHTVEDVLVRQIGIFSDSITLYEQSPDSFIFWLWKGIQNSLLPPLLLINKIGILGTNTLNRIVDSLIFKFLSILAVTIGIFSGVVTIIVGWNDFILKVKTLFSK